MKFRGGRYFALACALSVSCGIVGGAAAGGDKALTHVTSSLVANIENENRRLYSDRYRVNIFENNYAICAETANARERMCSIGDIHIGRHDVDLLEENFTRFVDGVPVSKGTLVAHRKFEIIFQSNESVVIYSPLEGMFVLKRVS